METKQVHEETTDQRHINIFVNDKKYEALKPSMLGRDILAMASIPENNHLFLEVPGPGDDQPIGPDEEVVLKSGMRFYDVPVGNFG
jgi:multiubiquitin